MSPGVPCAETVAADAAAAAAAEHRQCVAEKTQQRQSNRAAQSAGDVRGDVGGHSLQHMRADVAELYGCMPLPILAQFYIVPSAHRKRDERCYVSSTPTPAWQKDTRHCLTQRCPILVRICSFSNIQSYSLCLSTDSGSMVRVVTQWDVSIGSWVYVTNMLLMCVMMKVFSCCSTLWLRLTRRGTVKDARITMTNKTFHRALWALPPLQVHKAYCVCVCVSACVCVWAVQNWK